MHPKVIFHIECSLDGRIDWLKPDQFVYYRVIQDWAIDAMISGSNTILQAEMSLEKEIEKLSDQYLVVVDSRGRIDNWEVIKKQAWWNDTPIVLCSDSTPKSYLEKLQGQQVHYLVHGENQVNIREALESLNSIFGIRTMRIDSGGVLAGVMLRNQVVDEVSVIISPQLTGGTRPKSIFVAPDLESMVHVIDLDLIDCKILDKNYIHLIYQINKQEIFP